MKILGIDPGKTTGWAILQFEPTLLRGGVVKITIVKKDSDKAICWQQRGIA